MRLAASGIIIQTTTTSSPHGSFATSSNAIKPKFAKYKINNDRDESTHCFAEVGRGLGRVHS
jgi:hypothetical protein